MSMALKASLGTATLLILLAACGANNQSPAASAGAAGAAGAAGETGSTAGKTGTGGGSSGSSGGPQGATGPSMVDGGEPATAMEDNPEPSESGGMLGTWENVTPPDISLDQQDPGGGDNYGVQDVLADPRRPQDLYAFICYQGVWRSTDYGLTWKQVNKGMGWGKPWGTAMQPTLDRDPKTAPIMYVAASYIPGILKSADFGQTWVMYKTPPEVQDGRGYPYSVDIDPYDPEHILIAFHESPDVAESTNGGKSWKLLATPATNKGASYYPFFMNTGKAETTRKTFLAIPQEVVEGKALRTEDGGASWTELGQFQHHHGSAQIVDLGAGTVYMAAKSPDGIHKSTDFGKTWSMLSNVSSGVVAAGTTHLYTSVGMGWGKEGAPLDPRLFTATRASDATWTAMPAPDMVDGAKRLAVTRDASHDVVVGGNWHAGIWRFKQP
jgi:photosystem II stability/assembly factor-like uncharacterized protein